MVCVSGVRRHCRLCLVSCNLPARCGQDTPPGTTYCVPRRRLSRRRRSVQPPTHSKFPQMSLTRRCISRRHLSRDPHSRWTKGLLQRPWAHFTGLLAHLGYILLCVRRNQGLLWRSSPRQQRKSPPSPPHYHACTTAKGLHSTPARGLVDPPYPLVDWRGHRQHSLYKPLLGYQDPLYGASILLRPFIDAHTVDPDTRCRRAAVQEHA